jgi:hypothetical protein
MSSLEGVILLWLGSESRGQGDCFFMTTYLRQSVYAHNLLRRKVIAEDNDISCVLCEESIDHILVTFFYLTSSPWYSVSRLLRREFVYPRDIHII